MELRLDNINYFYKEKRVLDNINATFVDSYIYGITGFTNTLLLEIIDDVVNCNGNIYIDNTNLKDTNVNLYRRYVAFIRQENMFFTNSVISEMKFIIENSCYDCTNVRKRMIDALTLVGLNDSYLKRKINTLSESEKILTNIACNLIINPKVIMFDDIFNCFDKKNRDIILKLIKRLKKKGKLIIISSNDSNLLYELTDKLMIINKGKIEVFDNTIDVYKDSKLLNKCDVDIPYLIDFTAKAKRKNVKLMYHRDILDLIKDVYKHV